MQRGLFKNTRKVGAKREESVKKNIPNDQLQSVVAASCTYCSQGLYLIPAGLSLHLLALLFCAAGFFFTMRMLSGVP